MPCIKIINIGRGNQNEYILESDAVSSNHALLLVGAGTQHLLIDKNSANGTRVAGVNDGERITQKMVTNVEKIYFGDVACMVGDILRN